MSYKNTSLPSDRVHLVTALTDRMHILRKSSISRAVGVTVAWGDHTRKANVSVVRRRDGAMQTQNHELSLLPSECDKHWADEKDNTCNLRAYPVCFALVTDESVRCSVQLTVGYYVRQEGYQ